ncbi:VWA domain-containing protein [Acidobacteria bacterium AH-259-D05]|nr:VWA domain-containing protein [Acidobacteria bacterium AH-259-D05]
MLELSGVRIQNSGYLYLLFLVPLTIFFWRAALQRKRRLRAELFEQNLAQVKVHRTSHLSRMEMETLKYVSFTIMMLALVLALAQPQILREEVIEKRVGLDTVILLDLSYSMLAEDIVPSRLEKAKEVIRNFIIHKREEDRIGLVTFAETSLILSYLTQDPENLLFYFDYLEPRYGTNIGRAIKSGLRVFEREDEVRTQENVVRDGALHNRLMVLLSDGEDHGRELEEAVEASASDEIKIYCIGVGSRRSVPIPVGIQESGIRRYLQGEDGTQVYTLFRESTLREISRRTTARFYRSFIGYEMAQAFDDMVLKEREIKDFEVTTQYQDIYYFFLVSSLGLFFILLTLDRP